ncbi:hypothetical protein MMC30_004550 [Trapelia coarctata]|nr:hypothetical protein [Trapelia coarctata]
MASAPTSSAFMQLPRELRDEIYRHLLTTPFTFYFPVQEYRMSPAILTANKQISTEAKEILYKENNFVVVELVQSNAREWSTIAKIPHFKRLPTNPTKLVPALKITISDHLSLGPSPRTQKVSLLTGPEGIEPLVKRFWRIGVRNGLGGGNLDSVPLQRKSLTLELTSRIPSKLHELQERLLNLFNHVQGFCNVTISGTEDAFRAQLLQRMAVGPASGQAAEMIKGNTAVAEQDYANGNYGEAAIRWEKIDLYRLWIAVQLHSNRYQVANLSLEDEITLTSKAKFRSILGQAKALLRLGGYGEALAMAFEGLKRTMDDLDPPARSVLRGKLDLIAVMVIQITGDRTRWGTSDFWYPVSLLQQGPRSSKSLKNVLQEYFLAKEVYSKFEWLEHFLASKALWELMDNREEEDWWEESDESEDWIELSFEDGGVDP